MNTFRHELPWTFERHLHSLYVSERDCTYNMREVFQDLTQSFKRIAIMNYTIVILYVL